jgi:hypothetical protein
MDIPIYGKITKNVNLVSRETDLLFVYHSYVLKHFIKFIIMIFIMMMLKRLTINLYN